MRMGGDEKLDEAVYVWFRQRRQEKSPVTGPILCEKALQLSKILSGENFKKFVASTGRLWRFCKRFGIRSVSLQGEKLSADKSAAEQFIVSFR